MGERKDIEAFGRIYYEGSESGSRAKSEGNQYQSGLES